MTPDEQHKPNPGSPEAVAQGCSCPVMDNAGGRGAYGGGEPKTFWVHERCPIHGRQRES